MFISVYYIVICLFFFFSTLTNFTINSFYQEKAIIGNKILIAPKKVGEEVMPEFTAKSFLAIDHKTHKVLAAKDQNIPRPIASITKLMTAIVFLKTNHNWDYLIEIKASDFRGSDSRNLINGDQLTIKDAFNTALVGSDNVAILALVRNSGLSEGEFIAKMNQEARLSGMTNTKFIDPTGLSPQNISTADDLSLLVDKAFTYPEIEAASSLANYRLVIKDQIRSVENTNKLLRDKEINVLKGKTGYVEESGYCLISEVENSDQQKILIIILGSREDEGRFSETKALSQWVFQNYHFF